MGGRQLGPESTEHSQRGGSGTGRTSASFQSCPVLQSHSRQHCTQQCHTGGKGGTREELALFLFSFFLLHLAAPIVFCISVKTSRPCQSSTMPWLTWMCAEENLHLLRTRNWNADPTSCPEQASQGLPLDTRADYMERRRQDTTSQ